MAGLQTLHSRNSRAGPHVRPSLCQRPERHDPPRTHSRLAALAVRFVFAYWVPAGQARRLGRG